MPIEVVEACLGDYREQGRLVNYHTRPSGEIMSFPTVFMDALIAQRGYASFADDAVTDADRKRVEDARAEYIDRVSNRWRNPATVKPIPHQDGGAGATPRGGNHNLRTSTDNAWRRAR